MSELPEGWAITNLADIGRWSSGGTPSRSRAYYFGKGIPWIKSGDLPDGLILRTEEEITDLGLKNSSAKLMPAGTISIALYGATIGKLGVLTFPAATNQACANVIPDNDAIDSRYLFFYLFSERKDLIEKGQGGAQPNISQEIVKSHPIVLAPLGEQRRIAVRLQKLLGRVDAVQVRLATVPRILKRFRQSVLAAACSGRLTTDWREQMAAETQTSPDCTLANGDIPSSWQMIPVEQIAKIGSGQSSAAIAEKCRPTGEVGWFKVGDMNSEGNEKFMRVSQNYMMRKDIEELRVKVFPKGSIIFPKRGGAIHTNKKRILIEASCLDLNLMALVLDESLRDYFWIWFSTINLGSLSDGSNVPQINNTDILPLEVPLPPLAEQQEIGRRVEALLKTADVLEARYRAAKAHVDKLTQSILAKAFRGELVSQDPNDEPASVLLERIRQSKDGTHVKKRSARQ